MKPWEISSLKEYSEYHHWPQLDLLDLIYMAESNHIIELEGGFLLIKPPFKNTKFTRELLNTLTLDYDYTVLYDQPISDNLHEC